MRFKNRTAIVIGAGFAGLSTATHLAKEGWDVTIIEKNEMPGGRARKFEVDGFVFDMGPSWYWMPDIFERYFANFGKQVSDYYSLQRIDPSYRIYFENNAWNIPANFKTLINMFEYIEPGSGESLKKFIKEAKYKYEVGLGKLVHQPGLSLKELVDFDIIKGLLKLDILHSMKSHVAKHFKNPQLQFLMEFPVLFLGAMPEQIPALYSLMNFADIKKGTWYPENGMYSVVEAMFDLAKELGVQFKFNEDVTKMSFNGNVISSVSTVNNLNNQELTYECDVVIGAGDYHHIETKLIPKAFQSYTKKYWDSRVMAPSAIIYYIGLNKKINKAHHHNLFFDTDFKMHGEEIYKDPKWPSKPLFYTCVPSVTDSMVAPDGYENMFILIPIAAGLEGDDESIREKYFEEVIRRMEERWEINIRDTIIYKRSYCLSDFKNDYNSFKGNAYGLANTLLQTANLKPSCKSKKIENMYYTGQLTVPGPGVPPSLISGELVAKLVNKEHLGEINMSLYDKTTATFSKNTTIAYSTSYSSAINLLNKKLRQPIYDIYAYVRFADEIVDTFHQFDKKKLLDQFRKDTQLAFEQNISLNPILHRFVLTFKKYNIDPSLLEAFLDSMEMDLFKNEHDKKSYDKYIYGSAEVVGLMCLYVFCNGNKDQYYKLYESAKSLGAAFQKVNFLRDFQADYQGLNRIYFPNFDIANFSSQNKVQIEDEIQRDFDIAIKGIRQLPIECKFGVYVAYRYYFSLFNKIKRTHHLDIMKRRIRIPDYSKIFILAKAKLRVQLNLL